VTALGIGIALGPLVGGELGGISWRGPFFGVSVLMTISLVATLPTGSSGSSAAGSPRSSPASWPPT
jgi:MFS family permease